MLNTPSNNMVSCLCLGKTHGRFIGVLTQQIIIEHLVVAGYFFTTIGCNLMEKKSSWWSGMFPEIWRMSGN